MNGVLADRVLSRFVQSGQVRPAVILIDGHSGSGKTTLADDLAAIMCAQVVHLDELYPGWDGLSAGSLQVVSVLRDAEYLRYDWHQGVFCERITLDVARPIIVEGCGAITAANLIAAQRWMQRLSDFTETETETEIAIEAEVTARTHTIWLECTEDLRRQRAIDRDGEMFREHWNRWAAQETTHFARQQPWALATEIVQSR